MSKKLLLGLFVLFSAARGLAWTDGELLIWTSDNRGHNALVELGKRFENEMGVSVKVETQENITDKFQAAAPSGKGPDIFFWANDRIGEWADAGLIKPLKLRQDFKAAFLPMAWEAVTHRKRIWGYPLALECVSLICNKKLVAGKPPTQLSEFPVFARELKAKEFLEKYVCTVDGLKAIDAEAPLGVPALKALADEMSAENPLIRGTYENALNGVVMPNIPQMGRFWSSMKAAFEIATSLRASPEAALKGARKSMKK